MSVYGQYCPLALASEILCNRWTLLVVRELLDGSTGFNEIGRGLPLMSRSLLSRRLRDLQTTGLVSHQAGPRGTAGAYHLTDAGRALGPVVRAIAVWGQKWIEEEPSLEKIDVRFLMWDMRRNVRPVDALPPRFTVLFHFADAPDGLREHWLVFDSGEVDLCYVDPGHEVDVHLETDLRTMTQVWMGWRDLDEAVRNEDIAATGSAAHISSMRDWLGLSGLAGISKRPAHQRVRCAPR
ncbi:MAG: helix-turn-helix transcriptional regulator [Notoacmeibacter sp.]|nr:helix-turn-helix transcriptional regulator [Notoacmeibacter sp.]